MISYEDCKFEACYTHVSYDTGEVTHVATTRLANWLKAVRAPCLRTIEISADLAAKCMERNGIEQARLNQITSEDLLDPILVCEWGDGTQSIFDGNHRIVAAFSRYRRKSLPGYVVPPEVWRHFEICGLPEVFVKATAQEHLHAMRGFSGITRS